MEYLEKYWKEWNIKRNIEKNWILREIWRKKDYCKYCMNSKVYPVSSCELDCVNIDGILFLSAPVSPEKKRTAKPCVKCVYSDYANYQPGVGIPSS